MLNTEKLTCRMLAEALEAYGCRRVVVSPGTRNAPLIMAVARRRGLRAVSVVDERSAAFVALGMAKISGEPVAMVCTSGSAMLNYAPALAEAYYSRVPLVAVTADRPAEWIDQDDSQTIRQEGALDAVVLGSYSLRGEATCEADRWTANRTLNDALQRATTGRRGPVHINISLTEPLTAEGEIPDDAPPEFRRVALTLPEQKITTEQARELARSLKGRRVLIVGGFHQPDARLWRALDALGSLPGVAVATEGLANVFGNHSTALAETQLLRMDSRERGGAVPDVLITFGGALVSRPLKEFLRKNSRSIAEHWHVGVNEWLVDSYFCLTRRVELPAEGFFPRLGGALGHFWKAEPAPGPSELQRLKDFAYLWTRPAYGDVSKAEPAAWNSLTALRCLFSFTHTADPHTNLQLANGTAVRLALSGYLGLFHRVDSNRGVSGIDGCVSTAVGAAAAYSSGPTLLVAGDMGFAYDVGALWSLRLAPRLKIAVLSNGGGNIFRVISPTRSLPEREELISCNRPARLRELCGAFGLEYFRAACVDDCPRAVQDFLYCPAPALLEIATEPEADAEAMRRSLHPHD